MAKRIIQTDLAGEDIVIEKGLRPESLDQYVGQSKAKNNLKIFIEAAKSRNEPLDHVLFYGPPGLGKTTLATIIAHEMGVHIKVTSGPAIEKPGEMAAILNNLAENDILFIDEIHRLNRQVEEVLYPAMEDYSIDIMIGKGQGARSIRLDLPKFTLVGATTRAGLLTAPLRDRFGVINKLEFYTVDELKQIIIRSAGLLNVEIDEKGATELARRSRGTPRLANRLLKRVRDFAQVKYDGVITEDVANLALDLLEVDKLGLDKGDRSILETMIDKFDGGPVGLDTLAAALGEDSGTLEDVYEPYLIQNGLLQRTPRGRIATRLAYEHLGVPFLEDYLNHKFTFYMFCDRIRGSLTKDKERIMSSKNYIDVIIDGKIYNIGGFESEAYLQKVASYINNMIAEFKQNENYRVQKVDMQRILLEINIANDYFKAKKQADLLQNDIELKEKEVYDLKHELIVSDSKAETAPKELNEALEKIESLEKEIIKLQTELEK